jgi:hypothetical protein
VKHCPACSFSFPDFHHVCDFDGTQLIPDAEPLSLVESTPQPSHFRRILQSPLFWAGMLAIASMSNACLSALYDTGRPSTPTVKAQPSPSFPASIASVIPVPPARGLLPAPSRKPRPSTRSSSKNFSRLPSSSASQRRPATTARTPARKQNTAVASRLEGSVSPVSLGSRASISRDVPASEAASTKPQQSEVALRKEPQQSSREKDPKLTALLKTTWRVLKKPFKF